MARPSSILIAPGLRFGRLTVLEQAEPTPSGKARWKCRCDCGNISYPHANKLRSGSTKSCGCLQKELTSKRTGIDLTGQRFDRLTVVERAGLTSIGGYRWKCQCDCGNISYPATSDLRNGKTRSCECLCKENTSKARAIDLTGQRFGRLTVIEQAGLNSNGGYRWKCRCDCGNISYPNAASLRRGASKSCGCLKKETTGNNIKDLTGQCFGCLTVIGRAKSGPLGTRWMCRCVCGTEKIISGNSLRGGGTNPTTPDDQRRRPSRPAPQL
jgi:hypothetical protein